MEYKDIVAVTGLPGLYQLLSTKSDGAIIRSLDGKSTQFVATRKHNFTPLESIEVFTEGENVPLSDVFKAMKAAEETTPAVDGKDKEAVNTYFDTIYPQLDSDRVYPSDKKKMLKWYPILKEHSLLQFEEEESVTAEASTSEE